MGIEPGHTDMAAACVPECMEDTSWEDSLTERDLDQLMSAGEPVELVDETLEEVVSAFQASEKGVTRMPNDKRQIVTWLAESGFHDAAQALTEWCGPAPRPLRQRLREAHDMLDWLRHYRVVHDRYGTDVQCVRHDDDRAPRTGPMLDKLVDSAAGHEIDQHS